MTRAHARAHTHTHTHGTPPPTHTHTHAHTHSKTTEAWWWSWVRGGRVCVCVCVWGGGGVYRVSGGQEGRGEVPKTTAHRLCQAEPSARCHPNINKVLLAPCSHRCVPRHQPSLCVCVCVCVFLFFFFFYPNQVKNRTKLMQSLAGNKYVPCLGQIGCESDGRSAMLKFHQQKF